MTQEAGRKRAKGESKVGAATGVFWQVNEKFVPKGHHDNSPAFQPRVAIPALQKSRRDLWD